MNNLHFDRESKVLSDGRTASDVVAGHLPELLEIPSAMLTRVHVDSERAVELTHAMLGNIADVEPFAESFLATGRLAQFEDDKTNLFELATTYQCAETLAELPTPSDGEDELKGLQNEVRDADVVMTTWAGPCLGHIPEAREAMRTITPGSGYRDDASDTIQWAKLYHTHWNHKKGNPSFDLNQIDAWDKKAVRMLSLMGDPNHEAPDSPRNLSRRAYAMWAAAYNRLRRAGTFIAEEKGILGLKFVGIRYDIPNN